MTSILASKAFLVLFLVLPSIYSLELSYALNERVNISCDDNQRISIKSVKRCPELTDLQSFDSAACTKDKIRAIRRAVETCHGQKKCELNVTNEHLGSGYKTLLFNYECITYDGAHDRVH